MNAVESHLAYQLAKAVINNSKQTNKLSSRISRYCQVLGFFMRIPMDSDYGKVQMDAALMTVSQELLRRTRHGVEDRAKFFRSFGVAGSIVDNMSVNTDVTIN